MSRGARYAVLAAICAVSLGAVQFGHTATIQLPSATYYFHGTALDQANKALVFTNASYRGSATFDQTAPTGLTPVTQTSEVPNNDYVGNPLAAYWRAPFSGTVAGALELKWYWSTPNAPGTLLSPAMTVSVFADPDYVPGRVQPQHLIGRATVKLQNLGPTPKEYTSVVPVNGTVNQELMIQVGAAGLETGVLVHYDSVSTPSSFRFISYPLPVEPTVTFDDTTPVKFAPSTIASAHFLGAEPQTTIEHRIPESQPGRIDPNRIYVDWPLSTRAQIGQVARSLDGGDSFRLLIDPLCPARSRPNCFTGGGGDTEETVNLENGNFFFGDQEVVANESVSSSTDHGDTFPLVRQHALTNAALVTDRHWMAATNGVPVTVGGKKIEAFLTYHGGPITTVGQYIQGIDEDGNVTPQPGVGQVPGVSQSGPIRVDATQGPGRGWLYQAFYNGGSGTKVATAPAQQFQDRNAWEVTDVSPKVSVLMPWLELDTYGNAYMSWATGGEVWLSVSPIDDPRNSPAAGGRPGKFWTKAVRVSPPRVNSAVFAMVTAGDFGRIAVTYMGAEDCTSGAPVVSDNCPAATHWHTYVGFLTDALGLARGTPVPVVTGLVSPRVLHRGSICTGGTTCSGDRSLLDLMDIGWDESGRAGVVFMDNNNRLAAPNLTDTSKGGPFAKFGKEVQGPSLLADKPDPSVAVPANDRVDPEGDATWPNTAAGTNLPSLDLTGASLFTSGDQVVARLQVKSASVARMVKDLAAYNATWSTDLDAARLQYVVRFEAEDDVYHLSMDVDSAGVRRFFGGRLDGNDAVSNGAGSVVGARYATDFAATGTSGFGVITIRAPKSALGGLDIGAQVYSVTAFATTAPAENDPSAGVIQNSARTVDATPPFDTTLGERALEVRTPVDCTDSRVVSAGGWGVLDDPRAGDGTLCRNVGSKGTGADTMSLEFDGTGVDVIVAKGPRGGTFTASVDGGPATRVDLYRPPSDPLKPDNSGRKDLDFGVVVRMDAGAPGHHTLRLVVTNDSGERKRDMVYVDGFVVVSGDVDEPGPGATHDVTTELKGTLAAGASQVIPVVTEVAFEHLEVVMEAAEGVTMKLEDVNEEVLDLAEGTAGVVVGETGPADSGAVFVTIENTGASEAGFELWEVATEGR